MVELADTQDLKSCELIFVRVQVPLSVLNSNLIINIRIIDLVKTNGKKIIILKSNYSEK